jgi:hypothetical protein
LNCKVSSHPRHRKTHEAQEEKGWRAREDEDEVNKVNTDDS